MDGETVIAVHLFLSKRWNASCAMRFDAQCLAAIGVIHGSFSADAHLIRHSAVDDSMNSQPTECVLESSISEVC